MANRKARLRQRADMVVLGGLALLAPSGPAAAQQGGVPQGDVQSAFLQWPLPPGAERYRDIDGRRMHADVVAQAEIARRYRDQVNPKYWGRIIGQSSDAESKEWLLNRFRAAGLSEVWNCLMRTETKAVWSSTRCNSYLSHLLRQSELR